MEEEEEEVYRPCYHFVVWFSRWLVEADPPLPCKLFALLTHARRPTSNVAIYNYCSDLLYLGHRHGRCHTVKYIKLGKFHLLLMTNITQFFIIGFNRFLIRNQLKRERGGRLKVNPAKRLQNIFQVESWDWQLIKKNPDKNHMPKLKGIRPEKYLFILTSPRWMSFEFENPTTLKDQSYWIAKNWLSVVPTFCYKLNNFYPI